MMAYIEGEVMFKGVGWIVVKTGGIGYKVYNVGFDVTTGDSVELFLYDLIREDKRDLFGFKDAPSLEFFEKMIDINGVGPKLAQKVMSVSTQETLTRNILRGDIDYLTSLPGIGKKTAQKIILELRGVLVEDQTVDSKDGDTLEALIGLGYSRKDVIEIIKELKAEGTENRIREALKILGT